MKIGTHCSMLAIIASVATGCDGTDPAAPAVVDHGDGTYSMAALAGRDRSTTVRKGAMTWSYSGQARHSRAPKPMTRLAYEVQAPRALSDEDKLLGMIRTDADGSRWRLTAVDMPAVRQQIARADAQSIEVARGLNVADPDRNVTAVEPVGARRFVTPHSWTFGDCDGTGGLLATDGDNHYWNGDDDRVSISPTGSTRRKAMVEIRVNTPAVQCPYNGNYAACCQAGEDINWCKTHVLNCDETPELTRTQCSGVILRSEWVLTAAHCVFDADDNQIPASLVYVVRWDGVDSTPLAVESTFVDAGFTSPGVDPKDDWALLKLAAPLAAPYYDMDISSTSDSRLSGLTNVSSYGFPSFAPNCSSNSRSGLATNMWMSSGGVGAVYSEKLNFKLDGGPGHSGSPVFYCPDGNDNECTGTEKAMVIAVWSGWNGVETTMVGAKGPSFRSTATATMDNN